MSDSNSDARSDAIVVGGGLGGLATALGLARRGRAVTVVEPRAAPPPDRWGYTLWPPAMRALADLGEADAVTAAGVALRALRWFAGDGHEWLSVALGDDGDARMGRFVGVVPSTVVRLLAAAAERAGVRTVRAQLERLARPGGGDVEVHVVSDGAPRCLYAPVVVGADGPMSRVRKLIGVADWARFRPPGQSIVTCVGPGAGDGESRQMMGDGWSFGQVAIGDGKSWFYAVVERDATRAVLERHATRDPALAGALASGVEVAVLQPSSARIRRWASDGVVLMGDAAHPILPHLGLGGTQTLEDVPVLVDVLDDALRTRPSEARLSAFQKRREGRVSYALRASDLWALGCTGSWAGFRWVRDLNLARLSSHPELARAFIAGLAGSEVPRLSTRLGMWLP